MLLRRRERQQQLVLLVALMQHRKKNRRRRGRRRRSARSWIKSRALYAVNYALKRLMLMTLDRLTIITQAGCDWLSLVAAGRAINRGRPRLILRQILKQSLVNLLWSHHQSCHQYKTNLKAVVCMWPQWQIVQKTADWSCTHKKTAQIVRSHNRTIICDRGVSCR